MTVQHIELIQLIMILGYIVPTWRTEKWWSTLGCAWWCYVLGVDIFFWRGNRPPYAREFLNLFDVGIGLVIIYAKYRQPCRNVVKSALVFMGSLLP